MKAGNYMGIGKYILIDPSCCPSRQELKEAIKRLYKDAELLSQFKGKKSEDPQYLRITAQFLERIYIDNRLKQEKSSEEEEELAFNDIQNSKQPIKD